MGLLFLQGAYNAGEPGKLREFFNSGKLKENSGNFCKCDHGHRVLCIIVSNLNMDWLGGTVSGVGGAGHHAR